MFKSNSLVFTGLHIIAWIFFIGLSIEAGGLLVNFVVSLYKPEFVANLYQKLDLSDMYARSKWVFLGVYSFIILIALFKVVLFYTVIRLMSNMNLLRPFNEFVAKQISLISLYTFIIGLLSYAGRQYAKNLMQHGFATDNLGQFWNDSQAFILMAAVVYVIAVIFQRGMAIQNENDLTV